MTNNPHNEISRRIAGLTAEQRRLFDAALKARGIDTMLPPVARHRPPEGTPLSFGQERLWFLYLWDRGSAAYNIPAAIRLKGHLDEAALTKSMTAIVQRHEILRTTFGVTAGRIIQVLSPEILIPMLRDDFRTLPSAERMPTAMRQAEEEINIPFNLVTGPVIRARLMRVDDDDWLLVITAHHIVFDGWSTGIFIRELSAFYQGFTQGAAPALPPPALQYADYAAWQRDWLTGTTLKRLADFWTQKLADAPPLLNLFTDQPRPAARTNRGDVVRFVFSPTETAGLRKLAREADVSLFMTLVAGFASVLHRWSGQTDIVIGSPVANRNRREIEPLIGFFVNTLALRINLDGDPSFTRQLGRVRATALEAYDHQDMPFEKIVEILKPDRSTSYPPIFQVMMALQNIPIRPLELPGLAVTPVEMDAASAKFDLCFSVEESETSLQGILEYSTDIFTHRTIVRLAESLRVLLASAAANPSQCLSALPIMTDRECARMKTIGLESSDARPVHEPVHRMFEHQAARTPAAPALLSDAGAVLFAELNASANRLAHALHTAGAGPDQAVGLLLPRSPAMVSAMLAVLKSGAMFVPLDPSSHADRLNFIMTNARIRILVSDEAMLRTVQSFVPDQDARVILLDRDSGMLARQPVSNPNHNVLPGHCAYVIYTSGSTGRPKGVMVEHGRLAAHCLDMRTLYGLTPSDRELLFSSFCFDAALEQIFPIMTAGGASVLRGETLWTPLETLQQCAVFGVTILHTIPAYLRQVLQETAALPGPDKDLCLRLLIAGGDAVAPELVRLWREGALADCRLLNEYGPTETTITATTYDFSRTPDAGDAPVPIGRPRPHTTAFIVDNRMMPVPEGVPGELLLGGDCLARGYLGAPELTADRFVPDPFSGTFGSRLYRTGDRARWLADGQLEFLGRFDSQVKIRGFRIEPGEIECVLSEHPSVKQAAVIVRPGPGGEKRLTAYASLHPDRKTVPADTLRAFLQDRLPDYMVPATVVLMDTLPVTSSGKLDRQALPGAMLPEPATPSAAPRIPSRELMAGLWGRLLDLADIDDAGNFFELGGHSLLATQMVSRVREAFDVDIPLKVIFEHPTLDAFTAEVETLARLGRPVTPPITRLPSGPEYPLSFAQQRLWILSQIEPDEPIHIISEAVRLCGRLDVQALRRSLEEIVRRHSVLRSVFEERYGEPLQRIRTQARVVLQLEDLERLPAPERERRMVEILAGQNRQPFDLSGGLLLRAGLVRLADEEHVLALAAHHIAFDGWSVGILIHELSRLYNATLADRPAQLPELAIQYADYAAWQRRLFDEAALNDQMAFWKRKLDGIPALLELPVDRPRPIIQSYAGATATFAIEPALLERLNRLGAATDATPFMILFAAFAALLHRYTGSEDIVVGTPAANRHRTEIEGLIGCFLNILVLRANLTGDPAFLTLIRRVRHMTMEAFANQELPFEKLVEALQPDRNRGHSPIFQVMFVLQNSPGHRFSLDGIATSPVPSDVISLQYDMVVMLLPDETGKGLRLAISYSSALFDPATISRMVGHYLRILATVADKPEQRVSRLPLLDDAERKWLTDNQTAAAMPLLVGTGLHRHFEAQAARRPGAEALRCGQTSLTYAELNLCANRMAQKLRSLGVGPESRVCLCFHRSADMIISILAVNKAGGAYVPIDPDQPDGRLGAMLSDAQPSALICHCAMIGRLQKLVPPGCATLDSHAADADAADAGNVSADVRDSNLAYMIYTSGSTGQPKGVMIQHGSLDNLVASYIARFGFGAHTRVFQFFSFCFDPSCIEIAVALSCGGLLVIADESERESGEVLVHALEQHAITFTQLPPSLLAHMPQANLPTLATLVAGGEVCPAGLAGLWGRDRHLHNVYGPTEATVSTTHEQWIAPCRTMPIGIPFDNVRTYVLNAGLELMPAGVHGELFIGGAGVARGYANAPALTAERFLPDPFSSVPGARMYRTGDIVKRLGDGRLVFIGRLDHQVKLRGFRIELGEIEASLATHPSVRQVAVALHTDGRGEKRLVAYVAGHGLESGVLLAHLAARVPDYMLPGTIIILDSLPVTASGKVDRKALPPPDDDATPDFTPPRDELEAFIADIWANVLGVAQVGAESNFFNLGGHSLLAARVAARVRDALRLEQSVLPALFSAPTVAGFSAAIRTLESSPGNLETIARLRRQIGQMTAVQKQALLSTLAPSDSQEDHHSD